MANTANKTLCINRVKSTRHSREYDNTIGCFLRVEPIKLAVHADADMALLSQEIHNSVVDTSPYQGCPNLVKNSQYRYLPAEKETH